MTNSGMGRDVTQRVSVVTLLLATLLSIDLPDETNEHIEVRICGSEDITNDDIPIGLLDIIYVQ